MSFDFYVVDSSYKHIVGEPQPSVPYILSKKSVLKNEEFGLQLLIYSADSFFVHTNKSLNLSWRGLIDNLRIQISATAISEAGEIDISQYFSANLIETVQDDNGKRISDIISDSLGLDCHHKEQAVYIAAKFPKEIEFSSCKLVITVHHSQGYQSEFTIFKQEIPIEVIDYSLEDVVDSNFYMDLWQHPCNWARAYNLPYYQDAHFDLIEKYFLELQKIGQRVCDLIISDFPWAGQRCYQVMENHNNLFEFNIIGVSKDHDGKICCDFSAFDRYIQLAEKYRIADEINLFGVLGNWDARDFGNPLVDYADPIRIQYKDARTGQYAYFTTRAEVLEYLRIVFDHLDELSLWEKTLIMSDEPANINLFEAAIQLLDEAADGRKIQLKCAIHDQKFFDKYSDHIQSLSLNTCEVANNIASMDALREKVAENNGTLTWYSCCFPTPMNIFLKSPLIESRLIGWFTSYLNMHGFLRWSFGIWPQNVFESASYKPEKWAAGDMFFVYPSKNGAPLSSLRLKNMLFGLQDFILLEKAKNAFGREWLEGKLSTLFGEKSEIKFVPEREISMSHSLEWKDYANFKDEIVQKLLTRQKHLETISSAIINMDEESIISLIDDALANNISAFDIYNEGLSEGMLKVTELFDERQFFVSEVIVCADTLYKGVKYLQENYPITSSSGPKIVLAVVEGDLHEIGKNVVKIMFEAAGFQVIDMGQNVSAQEIVDTALAENADVIGLSTMMTTTMPKMEEVIKLLKQVPNHPKVIIGGGCINPNYAKTIGADGYSPNAVDAVKLVKKLVEV